MNDVLAGRDTIKRVNGVSASLRSQAGPLLFLTGIFFLTFMARVILAPLMPTIERDMEMGHGEAGSLFFLIYLGYCATLFCSGFFSSWLNHKRTIILCCMVMGGAFFIVTFSSTLWGIRFGLILIGMATGLYLPSGLSALTALVSSKDWGKAISIHELAPNMAYVAAPFLAEAILRFYSWRWVLVVLGGASFLVGAAFAQFGRGGEFHGTAPTPGVLRDLLSERALWIMMVIFSLGIGTSLGVYTMLPLYMVAELGMERSWANALVGLSRISGVGLAILAGWLTDRLGPKAAMQYVFFTSGIMTVLLGMVHGPWMVMVVFLQPMVAACFFPAGFASLSRIGSSHTRNVAVSLTLPLATLLGAGAMPAGIGILGEAGFFGIGIGLVGVLNLGGVILLRHLRFSER